MADLDFDAWLDGASLTTTSVDILQNPGLLGDYEDWRRRYERAKNASHGELAAGEADPLKTLTAQGEDLLARVEQSRSTWHLRALTSDDDRAIIAAYPTPAAPAGFDESPPKITTAPTEAQAKAFSQGYQAWERRQQLWLEAHRAELEEYGEALRLVADQRGAERLVRAVVKVEQGGRTVADRITVEQALSLPGRIGEAQVKVLMAAVERASNAVPEVPIDPLSHGSGDDQE